MTFSGELAVFLLFAVVGLITASLSLRYSTLNLRAVRLLSVDQDIIDGTNHLCTIGWMLVVGWLGFLIMGIFATLPTPPAEPIGVTVVGKIIRYLLIGTVGLWSAMTASSYLYSRGQWHRLKH